MPARVCPKRRVQATEVTPARGVRTPPGRPPMLESARFFLAAERNGVHQRHGLPLELILVLRCQRPRSADILRWSVNLVLDARKGSLEREKFRMGPGFIVVAAASATGLEAT